MSLNQISQSVDQCISKKNSNCTIYKYIWTYSIFTWYTYDNRDNEDFWTFWVGYLKVNKIKGVVAL